MDNQKQELITKLKEANNVLVTVSSNPSVDQLAACIGLTLLLNKMKKHATAVFSGEVPSTLQFLKPDETLEKNTDSLRDFIVSLDKSKADKLRYKVEDNVVKIFITPYKTSITQDDLNFSQGDFNVDVVLCLGVDKQQDLDQAITSHGRILHDATVAVVTNKQAGELGSLNWVSPQASSLSELAVEIANALDKDQMDGQIATSLLTGIVAETDRFSNDKTTPNTMKLSAELMAAGANQQLVANELQASGVALHASAEPAPVPAESADGTMEIGHTAEEPVAEPASDAQDAAPADDAPASDSQAPASRLMLQPPTMGGTLTANSAPESFDPSVDPLTMLNRDTPMLNRQSSLPKPDEADATDTAPEPAESSTEQTPAEAPEANADVTTVATDPAPAEQPVAMSLPEVQASPVNPPDALQMPLPEPVAPSVVAEPPSQASDVSGFEPLPSEPSKQPSVSDALSATSSQSLADLEVAVDSPHVAGQTDAPSGDDLDAARDAVLSAINASPTATPLEPTAAVGAAGYLNVQDLPVDTGSVQPTAQATPNTSLDSAQQAGPGGFAEPSPVSASPADTPLNMPLPPSFVPPADPTPPSGSVTDPTTAPPVPPPLPLDDLSKFTNPQK